ncbi:hypothetical protein GPECTOR_3g54 [Gonium pectorale]|uniref:Uncharacterized protein n=1 Tax=Gonium pectorale TaxID=33097 RepID=A0A150H097_GONPE|nr:hypothetical protein GPECTOR_3g54 [Gonium pectorale]|eukprot:KXZ55402.1 hypothetical protein GPECTOR_3g54 [Gonium pectorale]
MTCPDCGPVLALGAAAAALTGFPCEGSNWAKTAYTLRTFRGNLLHAADRRDFSVLAYLASLALVLLVTMVRPDVYLRHRHALVLLVRLSMAVGNTFAASLAPTACLAGTTAPYYIPQYATEAALSRHEPYGSSGGGRGGGLPALLMLKNTGLLYVALKAVIWGRVLTVYQLAAGAFEVLNGTLVGYVVARRLYGSSVAAAALSPSLLVLQVLLYHSLPCAVVWCLEAEQRRKFRTNIPSPGASPPTSAPLSRAASAGPSPPGGRLGSLSGTNGGGGGFTAVARLTPGWASPEATVASPLRRALEGLGGAGRSALGYRALTRSHMVSIKVWDHGTGAAAFPQAAERVRAAFSSVVAATGPAILLQPNTRAASAAAAAATLSGRWSPFAAPRLDVDADGVPAATAAAAGGGGVDSAMPPSPRPRLHSVVVRGCVHLLGVVRSLLPLPLAVGAVSASISAGELSALAAVAAAGEGEECSTAAGRGFGGAGLQPVCHVEVDRLEELPAAQLNLQEALLRAASGGPGGGAVDSTGGNAAVAGRLGFTVWPVAISVADAAASSVSVDLRIWDLGGGGIDGDGGRPPPGPRRIRVVAVGTCGSTVVLDDEVDVPPYSLYGNEGEVDEQEERGAAKTWASIVSLQLPQPRSPGLVVLHLLPAAAPAAADAAATSAVGGSASAGGAHRPLVTLPLLALPSRAAADEMLGLYDTMVSDLAALGGGGGASAAHVAAFHDHFAAVAADLSYLVQWLVEQPGRAAAAPGDASEGDGDADAGVWAAATQLGEAARAEAGAAMAAEGGSPAVHAVAGPAAAAVDAEATELAAVARLVLNVRAYLEDCGLGACMRDLRALLAAAWPTSAAELLPPSLLLTASASDAAAAAAGASLWLPSASSTASSSHCGSFNVGTTSPFLVAAAPQPPPVRRGSYLAPAAVMECSEEEAELVYGTERARSPTADA